MRLGMYSYRSLRPPTDRHPSPRQAARERIAPEVAQPSREGRAGGLPVAPTRLDQLEALVRAGRVEDPLAGIVASPSARDPDPDLPPFRGREKDDSGEREQAGQVEPQQPGLLDRVRYLYEKTVVPVREIAQLIGVSERTVYKYARRYNWTRRYVRPARGTGGRFVAHEESAAAPASCGPKALDPLAAEAAAGRCDRAAVASNVAVSEVVAAATIGDAQRRAREIDDTAKRSLGEMAHTLRGLARAALAQGARDMDDANERARLAAAQAEAERRTAELRLELSRRLDAAIASEKEEERREAEAARSRAENEALAGRVRNDPMRGPRIRGFG